LNSLILISQIERLYYLFIIRVVPIVCVVVLRIMRVIIHEKGVAGSRSENDTTPDIPADRPQPGQLDIRVKLPCSAVQVSRVLDGQVVGGDTDDGYERQDDNNDNQLHQGEAAVVLDNR
jgi:hypothetical protein